MGFLGPASSAGVSQCSFPAALLLPINWTSPQAARPWAVGSRSTSAKCNKKVRDCYDRQRLWDCIGQAGRFGDYCPSCMTCSELRAGSCGGHWWRCSPRLLAWVGGCTLKQPCFTALGGAPTSSLLSKSKLNKAWNTVSVQKHFSAAERLSCKPGQGSVGEVCDLRALIKAC